MADKLLDLVLEGKKSATASAVAEYGEDEPLPSVDGKFDINKKEDGLKFRGSSNQRIINVKESLKEGKVIELEF